MEAKNIIETKNSNLLFNAISGIINEARGKAYRAVNFVMVQAYWEIGRLITDDELNGQRAAYGKEVLKHLAERLTKEYGKGFDERELRKMCQFYKYFQIRDTLRPELSWSHYRRLLSVENEKARVWYMNEAADATWSTRQLDRQISTLYYERLLASRDKSPVIEEAKEKMSQLQPQDVFHDPYVLEFLNLKDYPALHESNVEKALIDNLQSFLLELGTGFCFVARQKRMRYGDDDFYIDLVFYHSRLKCHVLIDLKMGKLTHADVGQMDSYIRMFDDLYKAEDDNPTIGLILCSEKNEAVARYSVLADGKQMFAAKYMTYLPTEEELTREVERVLKNKIGSGSTTFLRF